MNNNFQAIPQNSEQRSLQSDVKLQAIAESMGAGIFILKNGKFSYVNAYIIKTSGYSYDELIGMDFSEVVHPDFRETLTKRYQMRMSGAQVPDQYEFKYLGKTGNTGWITHNLQTIQYDGEPAVFGTLIDITERKNAEESLASEKERLAVTIESIGDAVVSINSQGIIVTMNQVAAELAGCMLPDAIGKSFDEVFRLVNDKITEPTHGLIRILIGRYGFNRKTLRCSLVNDHHNERLIDLSLAPIQTDQDFVIGLIIVLRDITEQQKIEAELFNARKLESLGVLAGGIAHDFNNILTGVITNLFMAKMRVAQDNETYQLLAEAEKASFRASRLVKQLLTFSKGGTSVKETVSMRTIIEDAVGFCLSGSKSTYKLNLPIDLWLVEVDKGQIDQVLNNLVINADQSMLQGGTITVNAENIILDYKINQETLPIATLSKGRYVKVTITDEGLGISSEHLEKIFDPYFTTKQNGNGLGLTIAYTIVKSHRGILFVNSNPGIGTTFSFYLPAAKIQEIESDLSLNAEDDYTHEKTSVLLMDDDSAVCTVVYQLLKNAGYKIQCTSSGLETVEAYKTSLQNNNRFDVVVLDLTIPGGMGGKETVAKIIEIDPQAQVVVSSGFTNDPIMAAYKDYGFCDVINKPYNTDELLAVIKRTARKNLQKNSSGDTIN